ncbi:MAG: glucose-6-phosphate dehydrogenase [Chloroflexi bacterium]|nr:glucose-6-phosphate dehydrogenase [Chloroflexota bacterium]
MLESTVSNSIVADIRHYQGKPVTVVIFGASGDLTHRKLIPALFSLFCKKRLPAAFHVVGTARTVFTDEQFRAAARKDVAEYGEHRFSDDEWAQFSQGLFYVPAERDLHAGFAGLDAKLNVLEGTPSNRLYYLSTPPNLYEEIVSNLCAAGMVSEDEHVWKRVVIEKPFGNDLPSARELNESFHGHIDEHQIYRIDHYLGKETVQNMLVFRFANAIFEPVWNRNYVDHVQITVAEKVGIEHRGKFYDDVGVLRDMFQNHLMQLLTLVAMEPPSSFAAEAQRNERGKVLSAVRPVTGKEVRANMVRGQYLGYRNEEGVAPNTQTATYAALRLFIDNWRWQGVPFYLRSGKALAEKNTVIVVQFKRPPHSMFPMSPDRDLTPNRLAIRLQPDEGMLLRFEAKVPATTADMRSVNMDFSYDESFGPKAIPEAYERLLLDALHGDQALFTRSDQIELAWTLMDPLIAACSTPDAPPLAIYEQGSWGPYQADEFMARDGRAWATGRATVD